MKEEVTDRLGTINDAYQQRVDGLAAAHKGKIEEAEKAREESGIVSTDSDFSQSAESLAIADNPDDTGSATAGTEQGHAPNKGWTKAAIVDYIVESDVDDELERADLEAMTKAELLDRYIDNEG